MIRSRLGHLGLGSSFLKSQCYAFTEIPRLLVILFFFSVMRKTIGCSPLDNTLLLKQITETLILITLSIRIRFALWFTPIAIFTAYLRKMSNLLKNKKH